ncbi:MULTISPECIES: hypothetical protein [Acinetobacter]|jgi:hypothetical protein|uniref:Uncharacterized protein n=2 Tax=Acinetobacter baumannii TaxID=470 RepID=A0AAJ0QUW3_ACIBA|nr:MULTISPECIES: hypothetical protein [Acinetobacter]EHF3479150.1 hypothetical protein [Acinetobacter baumannii]EHU1300125.1 hypothetical protein [Acinetobacter baumannii]EHU2820117.1 hypothetical protein [Acinetobacter baumannii]EHU2824648.1 hypothetical protein [Acinetobacter baumannii]EHU2833190.1 hypothetical protein [Acinetobacter baumannii]
MAKQELMKAAKNLKNVTVIPKPSPDMAFQSFKMLVDAHHEYKMTVQTETTKREAIQAWRDVNVGKIEQQTEFLKAYLAETFKERRHSIDEMFERLDKGIESGNMDLVNLAMESITTIVKASPLKEAEKIIQAMNDPKVESIEF